MLRRGQRYHCEGTCNLVLMCSRHHHLLHSPGWYAKLLPDASVTVTGPGGRVTTSRPPPSRLAA